MHQKDRLVRSIDEPEGIFGLRDDGIVHVCLKSGTEINLELQEKMLRIYNQLTGCKKARFVLEAEPYCSITKEARDNAIAIEELSPMRATAVIVDNIAHKLIAEFYMKFNKPKYPYKVFSKFDEGVSWLLTVNIPE